MGSDIWSSTSSDEEKWQPIFNKNASAPLGGNAEDIQILLLGPPGSGKTSLQTRYTLRQFSHVVSGGMHLMGGHKHVPMPDGREVHLIIHEFPSGPGHQTSSMMDPFSPDDISRQDTLTSSSSGYQAEVQRKKLLEQSDAVMLLFNPWSKESFEWVNGSVVEDIINTGRKKKLTTDIVGILDGLVAAIPGIQRSKSTRSTKFPQKELPRMPNSPNGSGNGSGVSLFSGLDEKKGRERDRFDYQGELKRISIVVEGSALKRAEFMIHERDLPTTPEKSQAPKPLVISGPMSLSERKLPTIREVDSNASLRRNASMWDNHRTVPANNRRRDSAFSFRTTSSAYSQASSTVVEDIHGPSIRESNPFTLEDLVDAHMDPLPPEEPPERPPERRVTLPPLPPTEELDIPVLVVASITDRLKDNGGRLPRMVSALQGQELARKFGSNSAYIEVSAKSNANVDEAFGILVDQVMSKRAVSRRRDGDERPRDKVGDIVIVEEEDVLDRDENDRSLPARAVRAKMPRERSRSCMPAWWDRFVGSAFSWGPSDSEVSAITFEDIGVRQQGEETKEDVWGETVVVKSQNKTSWSAMRKSLMGDQRHSSSTSSTVRIDALDDDTIVKRFQLEKPREPMPPTNPFILEEISRSSKLPAPPPPAVLADEDEKNSRSDEALMDKLERKLSKKKNRPHSTKLGHETSSSDEGAHKPRRNEAILDKVSRKIGLDAGPLYLEEKPQPPLPVSEEDYRPLSVDSSIARSLARGRSTNKQTPDRSQVMFLTNYSPDRAAPLNRSKSKPLPGIKASQDDDTSSSIITSATSTIPKRRQHTSLISELPPSIPPLRFDAIRFLDGERRFTVMIRLAEQELEQQRAAARRLVTDDAAKAAPVTRSRSVGAAAAGAARRARGVGTNTVGPAMAARVVSVAAVPRQSQQQQLLPEPARGRKIAGEGFVVTQKDEEVVVVEKEVAVVRADPDSRAKALRNRRVVPKTQAHGQGRGHVVSKSAAAAAVPPPPPRRAATVRAVLPPTPASRPRTRPNSERRPPGRPTPIWI